MEAGEGDARQSDGRACGGLRKELKECILKSDCVMKNGNNPNYCMRSEAEGVDNDCRKIQYAFFECKRSMLQKIINNLWRNSKLKLANFMQVFDHCIKTGQDLEGEKDIERLKNGFKSPEVF